MYNATYISNGRSFNFSYANKILFDISNLTDLSVNISTSQGFGQIGETVQSTSISGKTFTIQGKILGEANSTKKQMLSIFAPFSSGRLIFQDKYYLDCVVKQTPAIGIQKSNPSFVIQLFAEYPYWKSVNPQSNISGGITPAFHFPVNYARPHTFGTFYRKLYINCVNYGNVRTDFVLTITSMTESVNPKITNVQTQEFIKLNTTVSLGEEIKIYRKKGILMVEKITEDTTENIFETLDETSNLFYLYPGDNLLRPFADSGENQLNIQVEYSDTVAGVYDGIS